MPDIITFTADSVPAIREAVAMRRRLNGLEGRLGNSLRREDQAGPRTIRFGRTTTCDDWPSYPTAAGDNTFVVEFGELSFDDQSGPGSQSVSFEAYDPQYWRIARSWCGGYIFENEIVRCELHHGRWFAFRCCDWYEGVVDASYGINFGSNGNVKLWHAGSATSVVVTAYYDWIEWASNLPQGTKVRIVWDCDQERYEIRQHECE